MSRTDEAELLVGADTHLDTHTAAICDARGRVVTQLQVPATAAGYGQLLAWANAAATARRVARAIEGTRHHGLGLARHLTAAGQHVAEIDSTFQSCKTARAVLASVLVTAPAGLRERIRPPAAASVGHAPCAALTCPPGADRQTRVLHQTLIPARPAGRRARPGRHRAREADRRDRRGHRPGYRRSRVRPRRAQRRADPAVLVPRRPDHHRSRVRDAPLCRGPPRSRYPRAAPTGTASTGLAAASATAPCTPSPSPACAATRSPRLHPNAGPPKARPTRTSAAASSAT